MRPVLDGSLHKRIDPPRGKIQRDLEPEKGRLGSLGNQRRVKDTVERPQSAAGAHEERICDPELGLVLISNRGAIADADAAPEDAEAVDAQEYVRPVFDVQLGAPEGEEPGEGAYAGKDDHHEGVDGVNVAAALDAACFEEESGEELEKVAVRRVPEDPPCTELEGIGVAADGGEEFKPWKCQS